MPNILLRMTLRWYIVGERLRRFSSTHTLKYPRVRPRQVAFGSKLYRSLPNFFSVHLAQGSQYLTISRSVIWHVSSAGLNPRLPGFMAILIQIFCRRTTCHPLSPAVQSLFFMCNPTLAVFSSLLLFAAAPAGAEVLAEWQWSEVNNKSEIPTLVNPALPSPPALSRGGGLVFFAGGAQWMGYGFLSGGWDEQEAAVHSYEEAVGAGDFYNISMEFGDTPVRFGSIRFYWMRQQATDPATYQWAWSHDDWQTTHLIGEPGTFAGKGWDNQVEIDLSTIDALRGISHATVQFRFAVWGRLDPADRVNRGGFTSAWVDGAPKHPFGLRISGELLRESTSGTVIRLGMGPALLPLLAASTER